ncbi:MAG TPA: CoA transferase, partial [Acidimicrobiia bacterium]|nr:CoA transferase [Acidimicrobiia bacterium]
GQAVLHRMVKSADVVVENMRTPVKHKLGFDYQTLANINPGIILGSISGFGQTGPYSRRGGVDQIAQGMGGMMAITGLPGQGPVRAGVAISDVTSGLQLAVGILTALHERHRTGKGRWVHTSLLESMIGMLDFQAARWTVASDDPPQAGNDHPTLGPMGMYKTMDGYLNLAASGGRLWEALCSELGAAEWLEDERFSSVSARKDNKAVLNLLIEERLSQDTTEHWVLRLNEVGVPCGPVNTVAETFSDPQVQHLGIASPVSHPTAGEIKILRNATNLEGVSNDIRAASPLKGQHSEELLTQFGFSDEEIDSLSHSGVVPRVSD